MSGETSRKVEGGGRALSGQADSLQPSEEVSPGYAQRVFLAIKRGSDWLAALLLVVLFSPLMLAIALAVRLDSEGPVFFRQLRYGHRMEPFRIFKFRTMVTDAEQLGAKITPGDDPRVTRVGYWLRKTKLDELPQLFNILRGEMSFVGPRPQTPDYADEYYEHYSAILQHVRPGVTDYASVRYRNEDELLENTGEEIEQFYLREIMPDKLRLHYLYLERMSPGFDLKIIGWTFLAVVCPPLFEQLRKNQDREDFSQALPDFES